MVSLTSEIAYSALKHYQQTQLQLATTLQHNLLAFEQGMLFFFNLQMYLLVFCLQITVSQKTCRYYMQQSKLFSLFSLPSPLPLTK